LLLSAANAKKAKSLQMVQSGALASEIEQLKKQLNMVLTSHELQVECSLQQWNSRGFSTIPNEDLLRMRKTTLEQLKRTMDRLRQCNQSVLSDEQMILNMHHHEKKVALKFQSTKPKAGVMGKAQTFTPSVTVISENKVNVSHGSMTGSQMQVNNPNMFSTQKTASMMSMPPAIVSSEQRGNGQLSFGNNNKAERVRVSNHDNILSRQPIANPIANQMTPSAMNQTQTPTSSNYFDKKNDAYGARNSSSPQMGFMNKPFNRQSNPMSGVYQNQAPSPHPTSRSSYNTPSSSNVSLGRSSPKTKHVFTNIQQSSLSNQRNLSSIGQTTVGMRFPQESMVPRQQQPPPQQQPQQQQNFSIPQRTEQFERDFNFQQNSQNSVNVAQRSAQAESLQMYQNTVFGQRGSKSHQMQAGLREEHRQKRSPNTTPSASLFGDSSLNQQTPRDSYTTNAWTQQNLMTSQLDLHQSNQQQISQNAFSLQGVVHQQQRQQQQQQQQILQQQRNQLHHNQYSLDGMNHSNNGKDTSGTYGSSVMVGKFSNSNSHHMNAGSQSHNISLPPGNINYQQFQDVGYQQGSNLFSLQQSVPQTNNQANNQIDNFSQFNYNQTNQMGSNSQLGHASMSMGQQQQQQQQQYQNLNLSSFQQQQQGQQQQQYAQQAQPNQQLQTQQQLDPTFQNQMYIAQHQGQQRHQKMQHQGQYNPGSYGNSYF